MVPFLEERLGDLVVDVLLLEVVRDLAVEVLQLGSLAEAKELVVNETVLHLARCPA
jgi:hypothetical protein